ELFFAVLEVDRVDDPLALTIRQREFDALRIRRVDHDRSLDLPDQLVVERRNVLDLVAIGRLQTDIDDMRAVADLAPRNLARFFPFLAGDQVLEEPRTNDVGPFADDQRSAGVV